MNPVSTATLAATEPQPRVARLFRNGSNQAVRLPRDLEIDAEAVLIRREGDSLVLTPIARTWDDYFACGRRLTDDVPETIVDAPPESRDLF